MPHAFLFGFKVALVVLVGLHLDGHVFGDFEAVGFEAHALHGVVGEQAHFAYADEVQNLCAHAVVAFVGVVAQVNVGVDGVVALLLQFVGRNFGHEANAASLLVEVEHHAFALLLNHAHGLVQLFAAVAACGAEDVARDA